MEIYIQTTLKSEVRFEIGEKKLMSERRLTIISFSICLALTSIRVFMNILGIDGESAQDHPVKIRKFHSLSALRYFTFCNV